MFYCEKSIPEYIKHTINCVLSVDRDAIINVCSDEKINFKNVNTLNLSEIATEDTKKILNSNLDDKRSIARIFYLHDAMRELRLKNFVHFDNDVLIYKPFSSLKNVFMENRLNITKSSNSKIIFGYSYINSDEVLIKLKEKISETIEYGISNRWSFNYDVPFKEEDFLGNIHSKNCSLEKQMLFSLFFILCIFAQGFSLKMQLTDKKTMILTSFIRCFASTTLKTFILDRFLSANTIKPTVFHHV